MTPGRFVETPEEKVIEHIDLVEDVLRNTGSSTVVIIGQVPRIDFLHIAIEYGWINCENYCSLKTCRGFLEYSSYEIEDGVIRKSRYRGNEKTIASPLLELRSKLTKGANDRRIEWAGVYRV